MQNGQTEQIRRQAREDADSFFAQYKKRIRRRRIYRACLCLALLLSTGTLFVGGYVYMDRSIPSVLNLRAGVEQSIDFHIPARAEIVDVSVQPESNIPAGAVTIDLNAPVTVRMGGQSAYRMQVNLFGFLPFKQVDIRVIEDTELIPVGTPVGIYVKTAGILVVGVGEFTDITGKGCSPSRYLLRSGDYIRACNGEEIGEKEALLSRVAQCGGKPVTLEVERDGQRMAVEVQPVQDEAGTYKIGVWVRDNSQGVGTMTYVDSRGNFGALGHGINDVDTSMLMEMDDGTLYETEIVSIRKGENGNPGEMTGMIVYADKYILGDITSNSERGIFGTCRESVLNSIQEKPLPIGLKQEIRLAPARILCTVGEETKYYDVEITAVRLDHDNVNRGIELKVTDQELLELTGGIVQGMSGAPIIQDGKIVGAVTHVLVQDSTRGYGIFIENMLEH